MVNIDSDNNIIKMQAFFKKCLHLFYLGFIMVIAVIMRGCEMWLPIEQGTFTEYVRF